MEFGKEYGVSYIFSLVKKGTRVSYFETVSEKQLESTTKRNICHKNNVSGTKWKNKLRVRNTTNTIGKNYHIAEK